MPQEGGEEDSAVRGGRSVGIEYVLTEGELFGLDDGLLLARLHDLGGVR